MSIVVHRTFVHSILHFLEGDTKYIPKFRKLHEDGVFSYEEFAHIADTLVSYNEDSAISDPNGQFYSEYKPLNDRWEAIATKIGDYTRGQNPEWDEVDDQLFAVFTKRRITLLREAGEAELAHLYEEHPKAYRALTNQGGQSLDSDQSVITDIFAICDDTRRTLIPAEVDSRGNITSY